MLVPSNRLLLLTALLGLPLCALTTLWQDHALIPLGILGASLAFVLADAWLSPRILEGLEIRLPELVRLSQDHLQNVPVTLIDRGGRARILRLGVNWPGSFQVEQDFLLFSLSGQEGASRLDWPLSCRHRGNFPVERCYLQGNSPLGLWQISRAYPVRSEFRVYPNLQKNRREMMSLLLKRGSMGIHTWRQVGQGREFEKLRDYAPGDSYDMIHWKATARRRRPATKVYQIERTQDIYVLLDSSRLSNRLIQVEGEEKEQPLLESSLRTALIMGLAAEQQGDRCGLVLFHDKVEKFVRASNGRQHYMTLRDSLYQAVPHLVNPDYEELAACVRTRITKRSLLVLLTSLDDQSQSESLIRSLGILSRQHLILVGLIRSPGIRPLFSGEPAGSVASIYRKLAGHMIWHELKQWEQTLQHLGIQTLEIEPGRMAEQVLARYNEIKRRQLL
jgi:uncharacterized protein (DUF58 family)